MSNGQNVKEAIKEIDETIKGVKAVLAKGINAAYTADSVILAMSTIKKMLEQKNGS